MLSPVSRGPSQTLPVNVVSRIDLSELVRLRTIHQTTQACNGVHNSKKAPATTSQHQEVGKPSEFQNTQHEIIQRFHQLLRDADAKGEWVGTGLHRSAIWGTTKGNTLNAEKVAAGRASKVWPPSSHWPGYTKSQIGSYQTTKDLQRN